MENGQKPIKAILYARCSTDESKQDVENQLRDLRRYAELSGWAYQEVTEYESAFKGSQPKLQEVLEQIKRGRYQVFIVYDISRFSRQSPNRVNRLLDTIVERDKCRFISRQEGIDSENELTWNVVRPLFSWFANLYSRNLSDKIREGIKTKKEKGVYKGGRPRKTVELELLRKVCLEHNDLGWRRKVEVYNQSVSKGGEISAALFRQVCRKLSFNGEHKNGN